MSSSVCFIVRHLEQIFLSVNFLSIPYKEEEMQLKYLLKNKLKYQTHQKDLQKMERKYID